MYEKSMNQSTSESFGRHAGRKHTIEGYWCDPGLSFSNT